MRLLIFVFSIFLFFACSEKSSELVETEANIQENRVAQNKQPIIKKSLEKAPNVAKELKLPKVKDFGITDLRRISENTAEGGLLLPPYDDAAKINHANFVEAKVGEKYTIVPLNINIAPFQFPVTKVTKTQNTGCDQAEPKFLRAIEFEPITDREILEIAPVENSTSEYLFHVFFNYPAVEYAGNMSHSEHTAGLLSKGVTIKTIKAAIDLDNDS